VYSVRKHVGRIRCSVERRLGIKKKKQRHAIIPYSIVNLRPSYSSSFV
jgi:hypothetical protein